MSARPRTRRIHLAAGCLAALAAGWLLCAVPLGATPPRRCITATVPWSFVLPDGSVIPAGALTLCLSRVHDPVTGLHELRAEGHDVGLYMSRLGQAEGDPEGDPEALPVVVFGVSAVGSHRLLGYTFPVGDRIETFRFYDPRAGAAELVAARGPLLAPEASGETMLIAAGTVPR